MNNDFFLLVINNQTNKISHKLLVNLHTRNNTAQTQNLTPIQTRSLHNLQRAAKTFNSSSIKGNSPSNSKEEEQVFFHCSTSSKPRRLIF
jgi:uncharacterized protein YbcV (DUF1398 family)